MKSIIVLFLFLQSACIFAGLPSSFVRGKTFLGSYSDGDEKDEEIFLSLEEKTFARGSFFGLLTQYEVKGHEHFRTIMLDIEHKSDGSNEYECYILVPTSDGLLTRKSARSNFTLSVVNDDTDDLEFNLTSNETFVFNGTAHFRDDVSDNQWTTGKSGTYKLRDNKSAAVISKRDKDGVMRATFQFVDGDVTLQGKYTLTQMGMSKIFILSELKKGAFGLSNEEIPIGLATFNSNDDANGSIFWATDELIMYMIRSSKEDSSKREYRKIKLIKIK
jgi:hypothetical protein